MRVLCRHGHFAFYPRYSGEIAEFIRLYDTFDLVREEDYYTFSGLKGLKRYSLLGKTYKNLPAITTFEGKNSWDVLRENNFVYHLLTGILVPKLAVVALISPPLVGDFFVVYGPNPLIQPGSRNETGQQILSYEGEYTNGNLQFRISEFSYE